MCSQDRKREEKMENFGSLSKIKELDKSNMLDLLLEFPEQCEKGVELGNSWGAES